MVREVQFTVYCMNYELLFACELQVTINYTNYELLFACKAQLLINEQITAFFQVKYVYEE